MITPPEIKKQAEKWFGEFLSACFCKMEFFPKDIRFGRLKPIEAVNDFNRIREELTALRAGSRESRGFGYKIENTETDSWKIGRNLLPTRIFFDSAEDYLRFISKEKEFRYFMDDSALIFSRFPSLKDWIQKYPFKVLEYHNSWQGILEICDYFMSNPRPGIYLREIPVAVHTKFIEEHKTILRELLDILIRDFINPSESNFEKRYNLKTREPLIRFRMLDKALSEKYFSGLTDLSVPAGDFSRLSLECRCAIIIENKTSFSNIYNFLCLPELESTIAIFGSGFSAGCLKDALWLNKAGILYWGDIDAHGFMILSQLRSSFPHVRSVMMDMETFEKFSAYRVKGTESTYCRLPNLTPSEEELYKHLFTLPDNRLEQERLSNSYVLEKLKQKS